MYLKALPHLNVVVDALGLLLRFALAAEHAHEGEYGESENRQDVELQRGLPAA